MAGKADLNHPAAGDDEVQTALFGAARWARNNGRVLAIGAGVLLLATLGPLVWSGMQEKAEAEAGAALFQAQNLYFSGNYAQALPQLQSVTQRFGGTPSGQGAWLFVGNCQLALGQTAEAENAYRKFLAKSGSEAVDRAAGFRGVAAALVAQSKQAEGAVQFVKAAELVGNPSAVSDWMNAGRAFEAAGDKTQALRAFRTVITQYSDNPKTQEARVRVEELKYGS